MIGIRPVIAGFCRILIESPDVFCGVVGKTDDSKLITVGVKFIDQMRSNLDLAVIEVELTLLDRNAFIREEDRR